MKFITVSGYGKAGKDTSAKFMKEYIEEQGKSVIIVHFADYLKFICKEYFGWDGQKDEKGRTLLQHFGTDVIRKREPTFWVRIICELSKVLAQDYDYIIVPDCRFPDEIAVPRTHYHFDVVSVWVSRYKGDGSTEPYDNGFTKEQREHESETSLEDTIFDLYIQNIWDLEYLRDTVRWITKTILKEES